MYKILSFIGSWQTLASISFESGISDIETKSKFTFTSCLWKKSKNFDDQTRTFIGAFFHETNKKVDFAWKVSFHKFPSVWNLHVGRFQTVNPIRLVTASM